MTARLVLGMDVGGTATRALVADAGGTVLGTGRAGGGNPIAHGAAGLAAIRDALRDALGGLDPAGVEAAVFGLAGGDVAIRDPAFAAALRDGWRQAGLRCTPVMVSDVTLAYVSGTAAADGTVLVAGTGAAAAAMRGRAVERCADGHGWLLGDRGSGHWLGRKAVQSLLSKVDLRSPLSPLDGSVVRALGVSGESERTGGRPLADAVIEAAHRRRLAELAPVVLAAAEADDPDAVSITTRAAEHLTASVRTVRGPGVAGPIVLGGGLLASPNPLSRAVHSVAARAWPDAEITTAGDGAAAAAWLAAGASPGCYGRLVRGFR